MHNASIKNSYDQCLSSYHSRGQRWHPYHHMWWKPCQSDKSKLMIYIKDSVYYFYQHISLDLRGENLIENVIKA
jgi:hypothetical protein